MSQKKIVTTTLGDLIVAMTDRVEPFAGDSSSRYLVVSFILCDLFARNQVRAREHWTKDIPAFPHPLKGQEIRRKAG